MYTQKQIVVVVALIAGITLAVPAAAMEGQSSNAISVAPINPDFLAYQKTAEENVLASSEDGSAHPPGLIPPPLDLSHIRVNESRSAPMLMQEALPAAYDLRSQGRVTPVKDQGRAGSCWSFSAIASLESSLLPRETRDFSENHMKNLCSRSYPEGFDRAAADGGNHLIATAYLARWTGPVNEEDDPYNDMSGVSPTDLAPEVHVQDVLFLPDLAGPNEVAMFKRAIMEHGAVYTGMHIKKSYPYYNPGTASYYYDGMEKPNHGVTVVGWNDTYDRNQFVSTPPMDGAWIIKNSWGTDFGDGGYFYLSYCDSAMGARNTVFTGEDAGNYDAVYQHDPLGWVNSFGTRSETGWFATVFTADSDEEIRAVSLYTAQYNSPYKLYIYLDPIAGPINASGPVASQTGTIADAGYNTIPLKNPVNLSAGQKFSVVMSLTTPGYEYPIPVEYPEIGYSSKATAGPDEGYVRIGEEWKDLTDIVENANPCLKAFTVVHKDPPSVTGIVPDHGYQNQTVRVTNLSGTGFWDGAAVRLTQAGQPDITASGVSVLSLSQITCTLDLTGSAAGLRDVVVENPDGQTAVLQQAFTIDTPVRLTLTADKDVVVRGNRFAVTISGEAKKDYRIFVRNASGVAPGGYPVVAPGQAGIRDYSPTDVTVTTNAAGTRPILFDTNQSTADVRFTIRVEDPADPATFDEVRVQVVRGDITIIATGTGVYSIGEEIFLSGTNTESAITYLFVTGPGLAANGSKLDDLAVASITRDADTFTRADVELDDTWAYRWDTGAYGLLPDCGTYTIYAVALPNARNDLADTVYGTTSVTLRDEPEPVANFTANVTAGTTPLTVQFTDASAGNPVNCSWTFGDGGTSAEQHPTHTYTAAGTYTVDLTVTNAGGSNTTTRHNYVTVLDPMHIGLGDAGAAAKGEVTQASLTISNASSLVGGSLNLTYDPAVVTVDAVRSSFTTFVPDIENEKGRTRIVFRDGRGQNGDVDICTVALNATGEPGEISPLKITVTELVNTDHQDITFAALPVPGEFQVLYPNAHNPSRYRDASNGNLYKGIQSGNTLYFGEEGLNLTRLGSVQRLVHYSDFPAGIVDDVIAVPDCHSFDLEPRENLATGCYYAWGDGGFTSGRPWVEIREPKTRLDVLLNRTNKSVNGISLTRNVVLDFALENDLDGLHATPAAAFMDIEVTTPGGGRLTLFGGLDLKGIPVNASTVYARGITLNGADPGTYAAKAIWPSASDFTGKGYDSNIVIFDLIERLLTIDSGTDRVIPGQSFNVTIGGDTMEQYIIYIRDAGLAGENEYPLIAAGQPGVLTGETVPAPDDAVNFAFTKAHVTTDIAGYRAVQFNTSPVTAHRKFVIRVVDATTGQESDEAVVQVGQGRVTLTASGAGSATIGDDIILSGTNSDSASIYLFLTGPGLNVAGVGLQNLSIPVMSDNPSTFTHVAVKADDTWEFRWNTSTVTGGDLDDGVYAVYAASRPKSRADLAGVANATVDIRFSLPLNASITANTTAGPAPLIVRFTDISTGNPTAWSWSFGDGGTSDQQHPTHTYTTSGNYTVALSVDGGKRVCTKPNYIKVTPVLFGDAHEDGEVNQADTLLVLQQVVGLKNKPDADTDPLLFRKTDVHRNGVIEVGDALFIAQYNVGLRDVWFELPG